MKSRGSRTSWPLRAGIGAGAVVRRAIGVGAGRFHVRQLVQLLKRAAKAATPAGLWQTQPDGCVGNLNIAVRGHCRGCRGREVLYVKVVRARA